MEFGGRPVDGQYRHCNGSFPEPLSSEETSSQAYFSKEPTSQDTSSAPSAPAYTRTEILNVSTEKARQTSDLTLQEALANYTITDKAGTLYIWQTTENAAVNGQDVDLLVYEEEADVRYLYRVGDRLYVERAWRRPVPLGSDRPFVNPVLSEHKKRTWQDQVLFLCI